MAQSTTHILQMYHFPDQGSIRRSLDEANPVDKTINASVAKLFANDNPYVDAVRHQLHNMVVGSLKGKVIENLVTGLEKCSIRDPEDEVIYQFPSIEALRKHFSQGPFADGYHEDIREKAIEAFGNVSANLPYMKWTVTCLVKEFVNNKGLPDFLKQTMPIALTPSLLEVLKDCAKV